MTAAFTMPIIRDPGVGDGRAEIGSEQWARRIRARLGLLVPNVSNGPRDVAGCLRLLREREGWRLLTDKDGRTFASLEEFCETPTPWGLGTKLADLERWTRADGPASAPLYWTPPEVYPPTEDDAGTIAVHPAAKLFEMLPKAALQAMADDIKANGLREPIVLWEEQILDGRNRMTACQMAGVPPTFTTLLHCPDPYDYVRSANLHRRHLTDDDRAFCAARMKEHYQRKAAAHHVEASKTGGRGNKKTVGADAPTVSESRWYDLAAADWHVSAGAIKRADAILSQSEALPELVDAVKAGTATLSGGAAIAKAVKAGAVTVEEVKAAVVTKEAVKALRDKIAADKPKPAGKGGGGKGKGAPAPAAPATAPAEEKPAPPTRHAGLVAIDEATDLAALDRAMTAASGDTTLSDKEAVGAAYRKRGAVLRAQGTTTPAAPAPVSTQATTAQPGQATARQLTLGGEDVDEAPEESPLDAWHEVWKALTRLDAADQRASWEALYAILDKNAAATWGMSVAALKGSDQ